MLDEVGSVFRDLVLKQVSEILQLIVDDSAGELSISFPMDADPLTIEMLWWADTDPPFARRFSLREAIESAIQDAIENSEARGKINSEYGAPLKNMARCLRDAAALIEAKVGT